MCGSEKGRALMLRMPRDRVLPESDGPFVQIDKRAALPWDSDQAIAAFGDLWGAPAIVVREQLMGNLRRLLAEAVPGVEP